MNFNWPLMENNITREDLDTLIEFLKGMPRLTQAENVKALEQEWSEWLGVKYSVFCQFRFFRQLVVSGVEEVMNYVPVILSRSPERSEGSAKNLLL